MNGPMNVKFVNAKEVEETYQYRNIKRKLHKTNPAIWYNKITVLETKYSTLSPLCCFSYVHCC
jgi:hypothetical protein